MNSQQAGAPRAIDPVALAAVLRRVARQPQAPWLHGEVARRMAERLPLIRLQPQRIVDWWAFLGAGAPLLALAYPSAEITSVEPTPALAAAGAAARRLPWWSTQRWRGSAVQTVVEADFAPAQPAEMVWANMMLHASPDPLSLMRRWHGLLVPGGLAMFACFGPDTARELRALYAPLGRPMGVEFVDMHDLGDMLIQAGFADPVMDQETIRLEWATPAALLAELRSLGGNVAMQRPPGLHGRRWHAALLRALEAMRGPGGRLALSFEIIYGHAFRGSPRAVAMAETRVSLGDMRTLAKTPRAKP